MRKSAVLILANGAILGGVFLLLGRSIVVANRPALLSTGLGVVQIQRGSHGQFVQLSESDSVDPGDTVRTTVGSTAEFSWPEGTKWVLTSGSQLTVEESTVNLLEGDENVVLTLTSGKLFVRQGAGGSVPGRFLIKTPHASIWAMGGVFRTKVGNCHTTVDMYRGRARVGSVDKVAIPASGALIVGGQRYQSSLTKEQPQLSRARLDEFLAYPAIAFPQCKVNVAVDSRGVGGLKVRTGQGDALMVNGKQVAGSENGTFLVPVRLREGKNTWKLIVTDSLGLVNEVQYHHFWVPKVPALKQPAGQ